MTLLEVLARLILLYFNICMTIGFMDDTASWNPPDVKKSAYMFVAHSIKVLE